MKFKIFISSRNNDRVYINKNYGDNLTEIRKYIKEELEKTMVLDRLFLDIVINEDFGSDSSTDSYNTCLQQIRKSDFVIALFNGSAGWAPDGIDMGICHAELNEALNISKNKTAIIDVSEFFSIAGIKDKEIELNELFKEYLIDLNVFKNPLKLTKKKLSMDGFKKELLTSLKNVIFNHLKSRLNLSNLYLNIGGNSKISLNWKKLKYTDRNQQITQILEELVSKNPAFSEFVSVVHSVPDNMSVEDAKAFTGRPFLKDQDVIISMKIENNHMGPIHFIGVYGNATELQVKALIGFPDITTIKEDFGIYVWEQNTHVQLVVLSECRNPEAVKSKFLLFNNWCQSNDEYSNIRNRAKARHHILSSINEAKIIAMS